MPIKTCCMFNNDMLLSSMYILSQFCRAVLIIIILYNVTHLLNGNTNCIFSKIINCSSSFNIANTYKNDCKNFQCSAEKNISCI